MEDQCDFESSYKACAFERLAGRFSSTEVDIERCIVAAITCGACWGEVTAPVINERFRFIIAGVLIGTARARFIVPPTDAAFIELKGTRVVIQNCIRVVIAGCRIRAAIVAAARGPIDAIGEA